MVQTTLRRTDRWKSDDRAEQYVRDLLVRYGDAFENHWLSESRERGDFLPRMKATIPGQYDATHGVDIFAVDPFDTLWIIEVSRGSYRGGAIPEKGEGKPVAYAEGTMQMSPDWRRAATHRFLERMPDALEKVRDLLGLPADQADRLATLRFLQLLASHRRAVIIPAGAHFYTTGTDVDFLTEVFTHRFPAALQARKGRRA
jgi:hypothetical protein